MVPFYSTLSMTMIQQSYPPEHLGRILGMINSLMSIASPIGLIFAGPLADLIGVEKLFLIGGLGALACGVAMWLTPSVRTYDLRLQRGQSRS